MDVLEVHGDPLTPVGGLCCDSRQVEAGDLFVAVRGGRYDGHRFIREAVRRRACGVVVESLPKGGMPPVFVRVSDSRKALAKLSINFFGYDSRRFQLIGVTGTNGKTTTTLLIESILRQCGYSVGVLGTLAYRWANREMKAPMTTPESLDLHRLFHAMQEDGVSHVVMEVSSHALALGRVEGCLFDAAVFTNLSQDHLDFHSDMEAYFKAKALLFKDCLRSAGSACRAVINLDDPYGERLLQEIGRPAWTYSFSRDDARVLVNRADLTPVGALVEISTPLGNMDIRSPLLGRLNVYNMLAAATTALAFDVSAEAIVRGLEGVSQVDGRLQRVPVPQELGYQVVVDYAHTPDAMEKSLGCLREMNEGRLLVVFGCGGDRDRGKRPMMGRVAAKLADLVIVTSDNPRTEVPGEIIKGIEPGLRDNGLQPFDVFPPESGRRGYAIEVDRKRAIQLALSWARAGDLVFIGGKGHETYQIVGDRVHPFDDRVVVREYVDSLDQQPGSCATG